MIKNSCLCNYAKIIRIGEMAGILWGILFEWAVLGQPGLVVKNQNSNSKKQIMFKIKISNGHGFFGSLYLVSWFLFLGACFFS